MSNNPTEIFAERLAVQTRQHDATDPRLIACHFTAGWLAAVDALNAKGLAQDLVPAAPTPDADGWIAHTFGHPKPKDLPMLIDVKHRDGGFSYGEPASHHDFRWDNTGDPCHPKNQIVAWRPAQP